MILLLLLSALITVEAQEEILCSEPPATPAFVDWADDFRRVSGCMPLSEGSRREVRVSAGTGLGRRVLDPATGQISTAARNVNASDSARYLLRRHRGQNYELVFNARFNRVEGATSAQASEMAQRVHHCFAEAGPALTGPNGETLRLTLADTDAKARALNALPMPLQVRVHPDHGRGDALNFHQDFTCATILHEFMHHAGLCDEYHETGERTEIVGACRSPADRESFMSSDVWNVYHWAVGGGGTCRITHAPLAQLLRKDPAQLRHYLRANLNDLLRDPVTQSFNDRVAYCTTENLERAEDAAPIGVELRQLADGALQVDSDVFLSEDLTGRRFTRQRAICRCPVTADERCQGFLARLRRDGPLLNDEERPVYRCPAEANRSENVRSVPRLAPGEIRARDEGQLLAVDFQSHPARRRTLLHPMHFRKILAGSCRNLDVENYNTCAQWAYSHSQPSTNCAERPPECARQEFFLGPYPAR